MWACIHAARVLQSLLADRLLAHCIDALQRGAVTRFAALLRICVGFGINVAMSASSSRACLRIRRNYQHRQAHESWRQHPPSSSQAMAGHRITCLWVHGLLSQQLLRSVLSALPFTAPTYPHPFGTRLRLQHNRWETMSTAAALAFRLSGFALANFRTACCLSSSCFLAYNWCFQCV